MPRFRKHGHSGIVNQSQPSFLPIDIVGAKGSSMLPPDFCILYHTKLEMEFDCRRFCDQHQIRDLMESRVFSSSTLMAGIDALEHQQVHSEVPVPDKAAMERELQDFHCKAWATGRLPPILLSAVLYPWPPKVDSKCFWSWSAFFPHIAAASPLHLPLCFKEGIKVRNISVMREEDSQFSQPFLNNMLSQVKKQKIFHPREGSSSAESCPCCGISWVTGEDSEEV